LAQVDRVEVLRGPGSSLYGADAVGGVVNVVTRRGQPGLQLDGRLAVGGYGSREASAGIGGAAGAWDAAATLSSERSRGVSALRPGDLYGNYNPDRDGYRLDAANASLGFKPAAGQRIGLTLLRSKLDSQYDGSEYLPPGYAQNNAPDFRTRLSTEVALLDWRGAVAPGLGATVRAARSVDDAVDGGSAPDHYRSTRQQAAVQVAWQSGAAGQLVLALEGNEDRARSTSFVDEVARRNTAAVAELTGTAGAWAWQGDLRRDDSSDFGAVNTGRLGGSVALMPGLRLRALAGTTFRAPSFNDLYFPGYGVAGLRPERGQSAEIGVVWKQAQVEHSATVYRNRVRDLIGYESDRSRCPADPSYDYGCAGNTRRARLQGATLAASRRLGALALKAQLDLLRARDQDSGLRLPRRAAHQASVAADWTTGDWTLGARGLRVGARPDGGKLLAAENTLDLIATWRIAPGWALQAKLVNATNADLEPARDYQGLGRQGWLSLRYEMR
jgi:vitamin B12 transporter